MSEFKLIVAGGREFHNYELLSQKLQKLLVNKIANKETVVIVSGGAKGADKLGEQWASEFNLEIKVFPANWDKFGKSAGYKRNEEMAQFSDALVAFWDGQSKGTKNMIDIMKKLNKPVRVIKY